MSNQKHTTLFDDLQDPKTHVRKHPYPEDVAVLSRLKHARRFMLDEQASLLVDLLCRTNPKELLRILQVAAPPARTTWVEMYQPGVKRSGSGALLYKFGALVQTGEEGGTLSITQTSHVAGVSTPDTLHRPLPGTARFDGPEQLRTAMLSSIFTVALDGAPYKKLGAAKTAAIWGFEPDTEGLAGLDGRIRVPGNAELVDLKNLSLLSIFLRATVVSLAVLNSVPTVMVESRPRGLRLVKGQMRPYADRTTVSLNIPKRVRAHRAYALKQINKEIHRKRLHEVRGHYRHVSHKPQAPGWTAGINPITGEPCWRKSIAPHLRGDPNLGVLEAPVTMVHGPRA